MGCIKINYIRKKDSVPLVPLEANCQSGRHRSGSLPPGGTRGTQRRTRGARKAQKALEDNVAPRRQQNPSWCTALRKIWLLTHWPNLYRVNNLRSLDKWWELNLRHISTLEILIKHENENGPKNPRHLYLQEMLSLPEMNYFLTCNGLLTSVEKTVHP